MSDLWLPNQGVVPAYVHQAAKAVREYDNGLALGRDEHGVWTVFIENGPHGGNPFPVFSLGHELPSPETIKRKLYMADAKRRGPEIVASIERKNAEARKRARDAAHEGAGEAAEVIEWAMRNAGHTAHKKVYIPGAKE